MQREFLSSNDRVLWSGKPHRFLYALGNPIVIIFTIIFGIISIQLFFASLFVTNVFSSDFISNLDSNTFEFSFFNVIPLVMILIVFIIVFILPIYRFIEHSKVEYIVTDKRVYLVKGLSGQTIKSLDYRHVEQPYAHSNIFERLFDVGTVQLTPDKYAAVGNNTHTIVGFSLAYIYQPYDVYHMINELVSKNQQAAHNVQGEF